MHTRLVLWYEENRSALEARGLEATLGQSPPDGRNKSSAWMRVFDSDRGAEILVWDTGECDLAVLEAPGTDPRLEHRQLSAEVDFRAAVDHTLSIFDP
jgi:hypothetical protein